MRRLFIITLLVVLGTSVLVAWITLAQARAKRGPALDDVIRQLDTRTLWIDSPVPLRLELSGTAWGREAPDGSVFGAIAINDGERMIILYMKNGKLFAANGINMSPNNKDRWWFCGVNQMKEYIDAIGTGHWQVP